MKDVYMIVQYEDKIWKGTSVPLKKTLTALISELGTCLSEGKKREVHVFKRVMVLKGEK